jgi:hypothetical protein
VTFCFFAKIINKKLKLIRNRKTKMGVSDDANVTGSSVVTNSATMPQTSNQNPKESKKEKEKEKER